jgi:predicted nucleotidyltransferase component of viral defense system
MTGKKYSTPFAFRRALEDRLKVKSQEQGADFQRVRRSVAFDRLLCRLFVPGAEPWLLKGGYAMELRIQSARVTKDIDLTLPAGIPPGEFCGISKEDQFAEKLHAYTRPREGRSNSRVKDLIDMVLLIDLGLESARLRKALEKTFARRNSHPLPPHWRLHRNSGPNLMKLWLENVVCQATLQTGSNESRISMAC